MLLSSSSHIDIPHCISVLFFLSLFSSDSKQLLYHLLTKSVTFSIMCWRNKINKMKSYCNIPQKKSTSLFFSPGKETYQSKVSVEMRRLSWATPPFHTVFAVHLNKCSVSCFVFTRAPKNANLSTVKNIAIFTQFLKYHSAKVVVCCQLNLWVTDWWTLWADWVRRHKRFEQEMFLKPSVEWRNTGQYWRGWGEFNWYPPGFLDDTREEHKSSKSSA